MRALRNRIEAFLSFRQGHPSILGGGFLTRPQVVAVWRESEDPDAPLRPEAEEVHRADLPQWLWRLIFLEAAASAGTVKQLCEELKITYPTYKSYRDKFGLGAKDLSSEEGRTKLAGLAEESRRMLQKQPYLRELLD